MNQLFGLQHRGGQTPCELVGGYGFDWSASPNGGNGGHYLGFYSDYWYWDNVDRAYGFPVRAVAEE